MSEFGVLFLMGLGFVVGLVGIIHTLLHWGEDEDA
jgi:hypothetical protein